MATDSVDHRGGVRNAYAARAAASPAPKNGFPIPVQVRPRLGCWFWRFAKRTLQAPCSTFHYEYEQEHAEEAKRNSELLPG
jgi:hypothetical protein